MISIVYICDQNYAVPARVSIRSVIQSNAGMHLHFYIMGDSVLDEDKQAFMGLINENVEVDYIDITNEKFDIGWQHTRVSRAALAKFYISRYLRNINKVIYLDCDVIVRKNIASLMDIDIDKMYAAQVVDIPTLKELHWNQKIGTKNYYSSGVMVLNLEAIRRDDIEDRLVEAKLKDRYHHFMDQDAFNIVFDGFVRELPLKYNLIYSIIKKYEYDEIKEYVSLSKSELEKTIADPCIIHYADSDKPWNTTSVDKAEWWYEYIKIDDIMPTVRMMVAKTESKITEKYEKELVNLCNNFEHRQSEIEARVQGMSNEINAIRESKSFKIGRIITFIPRKIRNLYER